MNSDEFRSRAVARIEEIKNDKSSTKDDLMNDEVLRAAVRQRMKTIERRFGLWDFMIAIGGMAVFALVYYFLLKYFPGIPFILLPIGWFLFLFGLFFRAIKRMLTGRA